MKKRDLKKKITEAYKSETPDLQLRVIAACEKESQEPKSAPQTQFGYQAERQLGINTTFRRLAAAAICLVLFISGLSIGIFMPKEDGSTVTATAETIIYLDVNPSVELRLDNENKVLDVIAGNEDAKIVLADLELDGIDVNTALKAIVGSMYVNGYLTEDSNSILISVNSEDEQIADFLLSKITEKINSVFENSEMKCAIIAQCVTVDQLLVDRAAEYGISVGKMHFLNKIADSFSWLSADALDIMSKLSINDLNLIYSQKNNSNDNNHEITYGDANINVTSDDALESILMQIGKTEDDISSFCIFLRPSISRSVKVAYGVNLILRDDSTIYRYEVDCQNGKVYEILTFATLTSNGIVYRDVLFSVGTIAENSR